MPSASSAAPKDAWIGLLDGWHPGRLAEDLRDGQRLEQVEQAMLPQHVDRRVRPAISHQRQPVAGRLEAAQRVRHAGDQIGGYGRAVGILDLGALIHDRVAEVENRAAISGVIVQQIYHKGTKTRSGQTKSMGALRDFVSSWWNPSLSYSFIGYL